MKTGNSLPASFRWAFAGLWHAIRTQRNIRIHILASAAVTAMGLWLGLDATRWTVLILTIALVFFAELINTVIETTIDLVTTEYHPLAKAAKDTAAGAVLVTSMAAVAIGLLILGPPLLARLGLAGGK
ncbi:MAG: hypothetical protein B6I34_06250 [Anaerolineaceae bacterium 4572_32.1]|nr:MAG: hypothetical protein B6I34_06250 [Anaerolineaceae bacterium 4572_32.1]